GETSQGGAEERTTIELQHGFRLTQGGSVGGRHGGPNYFFPRGCSTYGGGASPKIHRIHRTFTILGFEFRVSRFESTCPTRNPKLETRNPPRLSWAPPQRTTQ